MTSASPQSITVPPNGNVPLPINSIISMEQAGTGQLSVVAGSGVTINSYLSALNLVGQHAVAGLVKTDTDEWTLYGNIS
jgi:hypothetical protein